MDSALSIHYSFSVSRKLTQIHSASNWMTIFKDYSRDWKSRPPAWFNYMLCSHPKMVLGHKCPETVVGEGGGWGRKAPLLFAGHLALHTCSCKRKKKTKIHLNSWDQSSWKSLFSFSQKRQVPGPLVSRGGGGGSVIVFFPLGLHIFCLVEYKFKSHRTELILPELNFSLKHVSELLCLKATHGTLCLLCSGI